MENRSAVPSVRSRIRLLYYLPPSTIVGRGSLGDQVEQLQRRGGEDIETSSMLPQDQRWAEITMTSLIECILIPNIYDAGDKSVNYVVYSKPAICATIVTPMVSQEMVEIARHLASMYTTNPTLVPTISTCSQAGICSVTIFNILKY